MHPQPPYNPNQPPYHPNQGYYDPNQTPADPNQAAGYTRVKAPKPQPPPRRPGSMNPWLYRGIWLAVLGLVIFVAIKFFTQIGSTGGPVVSPFAPVKFNDAQKKELMKWGDELAEQLTLGQGADAHKKVNYEAVTWRVWAQLKLALDERNKARDIVRNSWEADSPGLLRAILVMEPRIRAKVLRLRTRDKYASLLLRTVDKRNNFNYFDLLVTTKPKEESTNNFQIIDIYNWAIGTYASELVTRNVLIEFPTSDDKARPWLSFFGDEAKEEIVKLRQLMQDDILHRPHQVLSAIKGVPEVLRKGRQIYTVELKGLRQAIDAGINNQADLERFQALLAAPPLGGEPILPQIHQWEFARLASKWQEAESMLDKIDKEVGGDPYLKVIKAEIRLETGDVPSAVRLIGEVERADVRTPRFNEVKAKINAKQPGA